MVCQTAGTSSLPEITSPAPEGGGRAHWILLASCLHCFACKSAKTEVSETDFLCTMYPDITILGFVA